MAFPPLTALCSLLHVNSLAPSGLVKLLAFISGGWQTAGPTLGTPLQGCGRIRAALEQPVCCCTPPPPKKKACRISKNDKELGNLSISAPVSGVLPCPEGSPFPQVRGAGTPVQHSLNAQGREGGAMA